MLSRFTGGAGALFPVFSGFFLSEVCEGSAGCVFIIFSSFLGLPGGSSFVNFSEKYSFLRNSAGTRFSHTVQRFSLFSRVGGLPK